MLVGKKKIKFKPSATSIAKEQETEPSSIHSTGATTENLGGEGRKAPAPSRTTSSPCVHKADCQLGQVWVASAATSLPGLHLPVVGGWQQGWSQRESPTLLQLLGQPLTPPSGRPPAYPKCLVHPHFQNTAFIEQNHPALLYSNGMFIPNCRMHQTESIPLCAF